MSLQAGAALGVLALALGACGPQAGACLPAARAEPITHEVTLQPHDEPVALTWYCEEPPPASLLDGRHRVDLVWVDGEDCDPCDRERIAAAALRQVCGALDSPEDPSAPRQAPIRLLCGPVPWEGEPWDRKGCVYAVASDTGWICD